jgi:membrane peptidoglycan carboxypeptidase
VIFARAPSAPTPVYDSLFATRMVQMMEGVVTGGTGTSANMGRPEAGKTGTSQNWRDAWFIGFTPDMLAGVWVGNDNNTPMAKVTGGEIPAAIWKRFMTVALKDVPPSDFPWLSKEPEPPPQEGPPGEGGPYLDEPATGAGDDMGGAGRTVVDGAAPTYDNQDEPPEAGPPPPRQQGGGGDVGRYPEDTRRERPAANGGDYPPPRRGYYDAGPGYRSDPPPPDPRDYQPRGGWADPDAPRRRRPPPPQQQDDDPPPDDPPPRYRY